MEQGYLSYKDQSRHYFNRPHSEPLSKPLNVPAAWAGKDLAKSDSWICELSDDDISEMKAAVSAAFSLNKPTIELTKDDFPLPGMAEKFKAWAMELKTGLGFQVIRGIPVESWSKQEAELFFWCFGLHLGLPGCQNPAQDLLGHVTDTGAAKDDKLSRLYKTASNIAYHCDGADVVGLLCLNKAKEGGQSRIVSSVSVFNKLVEKAPELAARLFDPVKLDIRNEGGASKINYIEVPPCRYDGEALRTFYHSDYFRSVVRHEKVGALPELEQALYDTYEEIAVDPELYLDMDLEPGDIQLLSNHTALHARTEYVDYEEPEKKRHLLRLWLSLKD